MAKKIIQRFMPSDETIKNNKSLKFLGDRLHDPILWHLNRRSVAKAFAIGLFFAWVPLPTQMAMSAAVAFYFRAHLAISVALVWITNPLTMPPMLTRRTSRAGPPAGARGLLVERAPASPPACGGG